MRKTIFEKRLDRLYREKWKTGINPQEVLIPNIFKERQNVNNGFINRNRIEVPDINSYCEKNWMPILDEPFQFVKWTNPTEIMKVNLETNTSEQVYKN